MAITGKSKWASPDPAFVAVQGSGSLSLHGGLWVPVRWLCFIDSCKLSLAGWGKDHFLTFVHWLSKYDNTSDKWVRVFCWATRGREFKWHLWMLGRHPERQGWHRLVLENGRSVSETGQGICSDFHAALDGLCIFAVLYKDKARHTEFSYMTNATKMTCK